LAVETNAPITTDDFRMLNRCLDDAIAGAVTMYEDASLPWTCRGRQFQPSRSFELDAAR
jgi:hypothetical protein